MSKNSCLLLLAMGLLLPLAAGETKDQPGRKRMEISVVYTSLSVGVTDSTDAGLGARLGFNVNEYLAVEAEASYFSSHILGNGFIDDKGQGLIGVKAGKRNRWVGGFGKLRAGAVTFYGLRVPRGLCIFDDITRACESGPQSGRRFALDAGAVLEFYPGRRVIVRADVGDTMIRFGSNDRFFNPAGERIRAEGLKHNFQFSVGVGFRF